MKTYTVPKISSLEENKLKDIQSVEDSFQELRFLKLKGSFVRIELAKYFIEATTNIEVDLSKYKEMLERLRDEFFYGVGYLFGIIEDDELKVYDVYTNSNYLSTRDMKKLNEKFGLPLCESIHEGYFTFNEVIDFYKKAGEDSQYCYLLPAVYINDQCTYVNEEAKTFTTKISTSFTPTVTTVANTTKIPSSIPNEDLNSQFTGDYDCGYLDDDYGLTLTDNDEVFKLTTKEERAEIFKETLKNIEANYEEHKSTYSETYKRWFRKNSKFFIYFYSILTLPQTRKLLYDYKADYGFPNDTWGSILIGYIEYNFPNKIFNKFKQYFFNLGFLPFVELMLADEFVVFDDFYKKEYVNEEKK